VLNRAVCRKCRIDTWDLPKWLDNGAWRDGYVEWRCPYTETIMNDTDSPPPRCPNMLEHGVYAARRR
jgi:hypothetical protein